MRLATFSLSGDSTPRVGLVRGDVVVDLKMPTLLELIRSGPETWRQTAADTDGEDSRHSLQGVRLHAPIPRPRKNIVCLGLNYMSHVLETSRPLQRQAKHPDVPIFFTKAPTAVTGPYDSIPWDRSATDQVDYEAELGVIIGRDGRNISRANALDYVFGYTIINDVSARDLQYAHKQWFKGKSLDGFCPMGPVIVTADEFGDAQTKRLSLRLNGETRQSATTADMIFPVVVIIEYLSKGMTLEAGDVIATGTPEGVGLGRTPPEYLKDGDLVEAEIEGIGTLRNHVVASRH
jgi:2-keto-4-pentenoate hydratase/2-oxohepta-3-ene-1,7-dioic acid hydratase in catechol pathway